MVYKRLGKNLEAAINSGIQSFSSPSVAAGAILGVIFTGLLCWVNDSGMHTGGAAL
jgi:hypothetical protein